MLSSRARWVDLVSETSEESYALNDTLELKEANTMSDDVLPGNIEHRDTEAVPMSGECFFANTRRWNVFYYMYQFVGHALWLTLVFNFRRPRYYFIGITLSPVRCYTNQTYMLRIKRNSPGKAPGPKPKKPKTGRTSSLIVFASFSSKVSFNA